MDILFDELIIIIFEQFEIQELFNNVRLVCKRWNHLINKMKFKELILEKKTEVLNHWHFMNKPIDFKNTIYCWNTDILHLDQVKNNFNKLKSLKIRLQHDWNDIDFINNFKLLEHLEFNNRFFCVKNIEFKLENLKLIYIFLLETNPPTVITIDSNKLEMFFCYNLTNIKIIKPETVKYIETNFNCDSDLSGFTNLETFFNYGSINKSLLIKLPPNLRDLYLIPNRCSFHIYFERTKNEIRKILNKKSNLNIFMNSILINDKLDQIIDKANANLIYENYDLIKNYPIVYFDYNVLLDKFNQKIPTNFFDKFNRIIEIQVDKLVDQDSLLIFLNKCLILKYLKFDYSSIDQNFVNQLPNVCHSLIFLTINENNDLNCEFILKLKKLTHFYTNLNLTMEFILRASIKSKFTISFDFKIKGYEFEHFYRKNFVNSKRTINYDFQFNRNIRGELNFEQVLEICKKSKLIDDNFIDSIRE